MHRCCNRDNDWVLNEVIAMASNQPCRSLARIIALLILILAILHFNKDAVAGDPCIRVITYDNPLYIELITAFENDTGVQLCPFVVSNDQEAYLKLRAGHDAGTNPEVVLGFSNETMEKLASDDMLLPLSSNFDNMPKYFRDPTPNPRWLGIGAAFMREQLDRNVNPYSVLEVPGVDDPSVWPVDGVALLKSSNQKQETMQFVQWLQSKKAGEILGQHYLLVPNHDIRFRVYGDPDYWDPILQLPSDRCVTCSKDSDCDDGYKCDDKKCCVKK